MVKKCPQCGFAENGGDARRCEVCGHLWMPAKVLLRSEATGGSIEMKIDTPIGRALLKSQLADADAVYASSPQFHIFKSSELEGWAIKHDLRAVNPTYVNGESVDDIGARLEEGTTISIGPERMRLIVRFEW